MGADTSNYVKYIIMYKSQLLRVCGKIEWSTYIYSDLFRNGGQISQVKLISACVISPTVNTLSFRRAPPILLPSAVRLGELRSQ